MLSLIKKKERKKAEVTLLNSDNAVFGTRKIIEDKEGYYTMKKISILQEDTAILTVYTPNNKASKYKGYDRTARRNRQIQ